MSDDGLIFAGHARHRAFLGAYLIGALLAPLLIGVLLLVRQWLRVVGTRWRIDQRRVERTVGILGRRTDAFELWRVRDIAFEQGALQRLCGTGRIVLIGSDATDPVLAIDGLPDARGIYERLREAVDACRRGQRVVELEPGG